jgi:hypothetical protein
LQEHPCSWKALGLHPRCSSMPPRNSTTSRREERPISKHQPLRDPNGYHRKGSGATVGDSPRGPLNNRGKTHFFRKIMQTNLQNMTHTVTAQWQGPMDLAAPAARQNGQPQPPSGETLLRSRGRHRTNETSPRSRAGRPLG